MILAYAIIVLIILAALLRRDLSAIGRVEFKGGWKRVVLIVGLFILQAGLVIYVPGQSLLQVIILNLSQIALVLLLLLNHRVPGVKIFALGIALNVAVMVANGGWMPITPETYQFSHPARSLVEQVRPNNSKNIILSYDETRLWVLSDIIRITLPWRQTVMSIGDMLLIVGAAQFILQVTAKKNEALVTHLSH
ncbi:MAG: DUF5317 family protein [Anaerolineae bacterium]